MAEDYVSVDDGDGQITDDGVQIIDPGTGLFVGTLLFCVSSLLVLPIFVAIGNRRARLRRARKEWDSGEQAVSDYKLNLETTPTRSGNKNQNSFDEISADGCHGCNVVEGILESGDMNSGVEDILESAGMDCGACCFPMCYDVPLESVIDGETDNFVQEQRVDNNVPRSPEEQMMRKRKSTDDFTVSNDLLDESKRTRRHMSDDTSCARGAEQPSFSVGNSVDDKYCNVTPDPASVRKRQKTKKSPKMKKLFKRAVKVVTKKQPTEPLSQLPHIPKKTFLDGGFYAPGNLRLHHQILQSQLDREHRAAKKRKKEKKAKHYIPPSIPITKADDYDFKRMRSFQSVHTSTSNIDEEEVVIDMDLVFGQESPYHPSKRKRTRDFVVRIAKFDYESKRLVNLMAPYTLTALACNIFAIIEIALISSVLGAEDLSAFLVTGYFLSMVYKAAKGFTDAQATLCTHAIGAGNYFLAGQYAQLTQIAFVLTAFVPLVIMASFMYQFLVWLDVSNEVATLGGRYASAQVVALLICGLHDTQVQFLSAIDPSIYSNAMEILMNAAYTAGIAAYLYSYENPTLVNLAWLKCCVAFLFIPINLMFLSLRGWLALCWVGMFRSNALNNKEAVKQMLKTGVPLVIGSLIRESEWGVLVLFASRIGTDDVAAFAVMRRTFDIFSSLIEGLCCGAELRCAYHMGRGNQVQASSSAYKSLIIGMSVGTALAFSFYGLLGNYVFDLLDYDQIGAEMTQLIPLLCLCSIVMTIGMLCWAVLGAQGRMRLATFVSMVTSWIVTIPISAYFVIVKKYNLEGLVAAVTMGYSVSSTILLYLLIRSNWKKQSAKVMRITSFTADLFPDDVSTKSSNIFKI